MVKAIAFYLPQFHPIQENDEWWGKGFTEWRNVVQAKKLFRNHYQPHIPADLGFYDLRNDNVRFEQAHLAAQYGISGFCYYHYWFSGKQLLDLPIRKVLDSGKPDFPYCLCWANENWTRRWDGHDKDTLISQQYSISDDVAHFKSLLPYFKDKRYMRIDNRPVFIVYRLSKLPDPSATARLWQVLAEESGLPGLYLIKVESFPNERLNTPETDGFDASIDFQPDWGNLPSRIKPRRLNRLLEKVGLIKPSSFSENNIYNYSLFIENMLKRPLVDYPRYPCVTPSWDNTARRRNGGATILDCSTPDLYEEWLSSVITNKFIFANTPEPIVFINAWNEWAEGSHLEPDLRWGHDYLLATKRSLLKAE